MSHDCTIALRSGACDWTLELNWEDVMFELLQTVLQNKIRIGQNVSNWFHVFIYQHNPTIYGQIKCWSYDKPIQSLVGYLNSIFRPPGKNYGLRYGKLPRFTATPNFVLLRAPLRMRASLCYGNRVWHSQTTAQFYTAPFSQGWW
jgi:hypothetical protein